MATLLLDQSTWDLTISANGDIAVASEPYSLAQDACSAVKCFRDDLYYDTSQGIPYFDQILGKYPPLSLVKHYLEQAALSVPGVTSAKVYLTAFSGRNIAGQVQLNLTGGQSIAMNFGPSS